MLKTLVTLFCFCLFRLQTASAARLAVGCHHTCVVNANGDRVYCWGDNSHGQCGFDSELHPTIKDIDTSRALGGKVVVNRSSIVDIQAGCHHTCVQLASGASICWGAQKDDALARSPNWSFDSNCPGDSAMELAAFSTCSRQGSQVSCWGEVEPSDNDLRRIECKESVYPAKVTSSPVSSASEMSSASPSQGLGTVMSTTASPSVSEQSGSSASATPNSSFENPTSSPSFGDPTSSPSFGDPTSSPSPSRTAEPTNTPTSESTSTALPSASNLPPLPINISIVTRTAHTCAVMIDGRLKCWGRGEEGQLGYGFPLVNVHMPAQVGFVPLDGPVAQVAVGKIHTCVLHTDGRVKCWGSNLAGQLGVGDTISREEPWRLGAVPLGGRAVYVAAGESHTCAVLVGGHVRCWGSNVYGQLGYASELWVTSPQSVGFVPLDGAVKMVEAGYQYTCAVYVNGSVKCWGNLAGLGYANLSADVTDPRSVGFVVLDGPVAQLAAGRSVTCARLVSGGVKCWGYSIYNQLGMGLITTVESPSNVDVLPLGVAAAHITVGPGHACATLVDGTGKCWGSNTKYALGTGNSTSSEGPESTSLLILDQPIAQLAAGNDYTCALNVQGRVKCWGTNAHGALGYGSTTVSSPTEVGLVDLDGAATEVVAGEYHACVIYSNADANQVVKCWGQSEDIYDGQLGYGPNVKQITNPATVAALPLTETVEQLVAGLGYTCAVLQSTNVTCWGGISAYSGELGYGGASFVPAPTATLLFGEVVSWLAAGASHTCAVFPSGSVKCWGHGASGQLGYGNTAHRYSPAFVGYVPIGALVTGIAAGTTHTCAVTVEARVKCWGTGSNGQLGYGDITSVLEPATMGFVPVDQGVTQIAAGQSHTCALWPSGNVKCWGARYMVGYGGESDVAAPETMGFVDMGGVVVHLAAAAGGTHTCAVFSDGGMKCWGMGDFGQLGYGPQLTLVLVPGNVAFLPFTEPVVSVALSKRFTCVVFGAGGVKCWGSSAQSQLGYGAAELIRSPAATDYIAYLSLYDVNVSPTPSRTVTPTASVTASFSKTPSTSATVSPSAAPVVQNVSIVAGYAHTCGIFYDGKVKCWGHNLLGALGYENYETVFSPADVGYVAFEESVKQLALGTSHSCALFQNGKAKCWGSDAGLGYGVYGLFFDSPNQVQYLALNGEVASIAVGLLHTCAIYINGSAKCWGENTRGELGYGHASPLLSPAEVGLLTLGDPVKQIAAGAHHTCALYVNGSVKCWGQGDLLGYGLSTDVLSPSDVGFVTFGDESVVVQLATREGVTCSVFYSGTVKCWGRSTSGALGYGPTTVVAQPHDAPVLALDGPVSQIATSTVHTCVVYRSGQAKCWGGNENGNLGTGNTAPSDSPMLHTPIALGDRIKEIVATEFHTCALYFTGRVKCWGSHEQGELGYGAYDIPSARAAPGVIPTDTRILSLAIGMYHTCALYDMGGVKCWGTRESGTAGVLGYGSGITSANSPSLVPLVALEMPVVSITAGKTHTGPYGQLGYGDITTIVTSPESQSPLNLGTGLSIIVSGFEHNCALYNNGSVKCWGNGGSGRLGYNSTNHHFFPGSVDFVPLDGPAAQISAGFVHTCALLVDGRIKCWGSGFDGTLGIGSTAAVLSAAGGPYTIVEGSVRKVVAGSSHTCALFTSGNVTCWGTATAVGFVNTGNVLQPGNDTYVNTGGNVTDLIASVLGSDVTCAIFTTGKMKCWGGSPSGYQLGDPDLQMIQDPGDVDVLDIPGNITSVAISDRITCAVADVGVRCWGRGDRGQLGYGASNLVLTPTQVDYVPGLSLFHNRSVIAPSQSPTPTASASPTPSMSLSPTSMPTPWLEFIAPIIRTGGRHTCALFSNGSVKCWGSSDVGQLGCGNVSQVWRPDEAPFLQLGGIATKLTVGLEHTCVVLYHSFVKCWGGNSFGQLGYGHQNNTYAPPIPFVSLDGSVKDVVAGPRHTCALFHDGRIKCWGENGDGQLGVGNYEPMPAPGAFLPVANVTQLALGETHTCVLYVNKTVHCWGSNDFNQLGHRSRAALYPSPASSPVLQLGKNVTQVAAGSTHTCVLFVDQTMKCWGSNSFGQLGYAFMATVESPDDVGAVPIGNVEQLSIGWFHTCVKHLFEDALCWGLGSHGQLGTGSSLSVDSPNGALNLPLGSPISHISAGKDHTCVQYYPGNVKCWGSTAHGATGYGNGVSVSLPAEMDFVQTPSLVTDVSAGLTHTCVVYSPFGSAACWGMTTISPYGGNILGYEGLTQLTSPALAPLMDFGAPLKLIAAAKDHTCALYVNGSVKCWGFNDLNQLGVSGVVVALPPHIGFVPLEALVEDLTVGSAHTCVQFVNGNVRCWGWNGFGQLGVGSEEQSHNTTSAPLVPLNVNISQIAAGQHHTCALYLNGSLKCWGRNDMGQLGINNLIMQRSAANVPFIQAQGTIIQVAAGTYHTCALYTNQRVKCWGAGAHGKLGFGDELDKQQPSPFWVSTIKNVSSISAGEAHTCALLVDGNATCWGSNSEGQLGLGATEKVSQPFSVPALVLGAHIAEITCGQSHTCARFTNGTLKCWGDNLFGQLGYGNAATIWTPSAVGNVPSLILQVP